MRQLFLGGAHPQLRQPEHHAQEVGLAQEVEEVEGLLLKFVKLLQEQV